MQGNTIRIALAAACVGALLVACTDEATSPQARTAQPTTGTAALSVAPPERFVQQAELEPFFINAMPEFMFRSSVNTDFIVQQFVSAPNNNQPGPWHTHPGPTFSQVVAGQVVITRYTKQDGCVATTYDPGEGYFEAPGEVHRVTILGTVEAVEYKVRFYPAGAPLSKPAVPPPC